ncbi:MAG: hypothetical protein ACXADU_00985 [Promethearchaeota archaeon]|jgi:hypothetical protein
MAKELSKWLKIVLLVHFILGIILGIIFLFIPEFYCTLVGVVLMDHGMLRLIGAASIALGMGSFLAYRSNDWDKAKIIVQLELIWLIFAIVAMIWWLIESGPIAGWWIFGMFVAFLGAFGYFYFDQEK